MVVNVTIGTGWTEVPTGGSIAPTLYNAADEAIEVRFNESTDTFSIAVGESLRNAPLCGTVEARCASGGKVLQVLRGVRP